MRDNAIIPVLLSIIATSKAFAPSTSFSRNSMALRVTTAAPPQDTPMRNVINSMHMKDIRDELATYGVDCSSIFEKNELVDALIKARYDHWMQKEFEENDSTFADKAYTWNDNEAENSSHTDDRDTASDNEAKTFTFKQGLEDMADILKDNVRKERIKLEMAKLKDMKVQELRKELESYGVPTKGYFEKSEFTKAVAEARVDGVKKKQTFFSSDRKNAVGNQWDPSFKDVRVFRFDSSTLDPYDVIDVQSRQ
jgi:hypothetical protein